jgi:hypothetical protein
MAMVRRKFLGNFARSGLVILGILALDVHAASPPGAAPMDLVPQGQDRNGLPLNPQWQYHLSTQQLPDPPNLPECQKGLQKTTCTTQQTSTDTFRSFFRFLGVCKEVPGTIEGHLNYELVTYDGSLTWHGWEPPFLDSDYGFALRRADRAGMTAGSRDGIALEFFSRETIEHFQSPWWRTFRDAVKHVSGTNPAALVDGRFAIVSGWVGLDCVHGCDAEIHPALAVAIRVEESADTERWAVFAAGSGNEGFCSKGRHSMTTPDQRYTVLLPWKPGMRSVVVNPQFHATDPQAETPRPTPVTGEGILLDFDLKGLAKYNTMDGELRLEWSDKLVATGTGRTGFRTAALRSRPEQERGVAPVQEATPESDDEMLRGSSERFSHLLLRLSPEVRKAFISELKEQLSRLPPPPYAKYKDHELKSEPVRPMSAEQFREQFRPGSRPQLMVVEDPEKAAYDKVLERVVKKFAKELKAANMLMESRR